MTTLVPGLTSDNMLIRLSVGALVVFGSLYVLDSFGMPGAFGIALLVGAGVLLAQQADRSTSGNPNTPEAPMITLRKVTP